MRYISYTDRLYDIEDVEELSDFVNSEELEDLYDFMGNDLEECPIKAEAEEKLRELEEDMQTELTILEEEYRRKFSQLERAVENLRGKCDSLQKECALAENKARFLEEKISRLQRLLRRRFWGYAVAAVSGMGILLLLQTIIGILR
ncbi:MAG: hypothetical protein ACUVXI_12205 [bacterium]